MFKLYQKREQEYFWSQAPFTHFVHNDWNECQRALLLAIENHRPRAMAPDNLRVMVALTQATAIVSRPWREGTKRRSFKFISADNSTVWKYQIRWEDDGVQKG